MNRKTFLNSILAAAIAAAALVALAPQGQLIPAAQAATPNVPVNTGIMVIPLHISGQYTTTTASVSKFAMPQPCDMIGVGVSARAVGTTAVNVNVLSGGTTILSGQIAGSTTYTEGTISTSAIADEASITVDINMPSGASTINDATVLLTCARR